ALGSGVGALAPALAHQGGGPRGHPAAARRRHADHPALPRADQPHLGPAARRVAARAAGARPGAGGGGRRGIEAAPLEAAPPRGGGGVWGPLPAPLRPAYVRWLLVALVLALLEALVRVGAIRPTVIPAPTAVGQALADSFRTGEALRALGRTAAELGISF